MSRLSSMAGSGPLLNRLITEHSNAINFATGRPRDADLPADGMTRWLDLYVSQEARRGNGNDTAVRRTLGQYAANAGLIRDHLARYFSRADLGDVDPETVLVSNGGQEAIVLCLSVLVGRDKVCLSGDPVYFGLIGAAQSFGFGLETVPHDERFLDHVEERLARSGEPRVGMIYAIPDYDNPTGRLMSARDRQRLVALADRYDTHVFEDAVYRRYRFDGDPVPVLKAFDRMGRVIHVESFSKTVMPGLRIAAMIANGRLSDGTSLMARLTGVKSALSVTTSPVVQAILAGLLHETDDNLDPFVAPRVDHLKRNRDRLVQALAQAFPNRTQSVWPVPGGGFYLCFDPGVPFTFDDTLRCAEQVNVIVPPLALFSLQGGWENHVRLAFSNMDEAAIDRGIDLWARYLRQRG